MDVQIKHMIRRSTFDGWKIAPRYINEYEIVYIASGYGDITIEEKHIQVSAGDMIFFRPGVKHSLWITRKPYMVLYGVHFTCESDEITDDIPEHVHLEDHHFADILFKRLNDEYLQNNYLRRWKLNIILQQIICEHLTRLHTNTEPISVMRIRKILEYIHEDPCREYTLNDLLERVGIKKSVFLQNFRNITGTTPLQYITNLRLELARELLSETDLQISQISERCGFDDPFYFSRCFKKNFSVSPRKYREYKKCK